MRLHPPKAKAFCALIVSCLLAGALRPSAGLADGALAVALPPDVAKKGFSYGYSYNHPDADKAEADSLERCRNSTKNESLRALCRVTENFRDRCIAVAMDPRDGTPGVGWSIADNYRTARM